VRTNLEGALEKLDAGTRRHIEGQITLAAASPRSTA